MRVALLISGYLRSITLNLPTIKDRILDRFDHVDVYLHTTNNESMEDRYLNKITTDDIERITKVLKPISIISEPNIKCSSDKKTNNTINSWLKYYKLNQLKCNNESEFGDYDLVIKYRPDINLNYNIPKNIDDHIHIPKDSKLDKSKLNNHDDKYVCDILAYGSSVLMNSYFSIYESIDDLIDVYGHVSETLLYYHLKNKNIKYKEIDIDYSVILSSCNVFAIAGDSGSGKTTLGSILKRFFSDSLMLECDRYHKWERGDDNWNHLTHLNPEANYLTKMNEDIFDLKIGKDIYQVDYDHKTGKFTDKKLIKSDSENIIVCGLHSLYDYNNLYDLKIFIDTDNELTKKWKIKRDVIERGHTLDKVLAQIESRKLDFEQYILPQKDISDLIIKFYESDELALKLSISKKYDINKLDTLLKSKGMVYDINDGSKFVELNFKKYIELNLWEDTIILENYYNYIVFIILNLI